MSQQTQPSALSLEYLNDELTKIQASIAKQANVIARTGSQFLRASVEEARSTLGGEAKSRRADQDSEQVVTQDDLLQLVTELQAQLDALDVRSETRLQNAFLQKDTDELAMVPNKNGDLPLPEQHFPETLGEFKELSGGELQIWLKWYEILPPDEVETEALLRESGVQADDFTDKELEDILAKARGSAVVDAAAEIQYFNSLARYLGIRHRK